MFSSELSYIDFLHAISTQLLPTSFRDNLVCSYCFLKIVSSYEVETRLYLRTFRKNREWKTENI